MVRIIPAIKLRKERVKKLLSSYEDQIDFLWEVRNIDFYGNVKIGSQKRSISPEEVEKGLKTVKKIMEEIEIIIQINRK